MNRFGCDLSPVSSDKEQKSAQRNKMKCNLFHYEYCGEHFNFHPVCSDISLAMSLLIHKDNNTNYIKSTFLLWFTFLGFILTNSLLESKQFDQHFDQHFDHVPNTKAYAHKHFHTSKKSYRFNILKYLVENISSRISAGSEKRATDVS